jgi:uncharacterized protein YecE (DUF72 family)
MTRIGTAGWTNPPAEKGRRTKDSTHLHHYAASFDCVEINSSFYRSHRQATYARWREETPDNFAFSVKMPRRITHGCALRNCRPEIEQFLSEISGLGAKLRVILVQLPPKLSFDFGIATRFFALLSGTDAPHIALEPRHESWFSARPDELLSRSEVARVAADPPRARNGGIPGGATYLAYYRLHGSPQTYYSRYTTAFLERQAALMRSLPAPASDAWCIFDNTARYEAWSDALRLKDMLPCGLANRSRSERHQLST